MEIYIELAGVKLGPYSEKQVREYLVEGLLSLSDPARLEGSDQWEAVNIVLDKIPPAPPIPETPPPPPEPVAVAPEPLPTPEPATLIPVTETPKVVTTTTLALPVVAPKTEPAAFMTGPLVIKSFEKKVAQKKFATSQIPHPSTLSRPSEGLSAKAKKTGLESTDLSALAKALANRTESKVESETKAVPPVQVPPLPTPATPPPTVPVPAAPSIPVEKLVEKPAEVLAEKPAPKAPEKPPERITSVISSVVRALTSKPEARKLEPEIKKVKPEPQKIIEPEVKKAAPELKVEPEPKKPDTETKKLEPEVKKVEPEPQKIVEPEPRKIEPEAKKPESETKAVPTVSVGPAPIPLQSSMAQTISVAPPAPTATKPLPLVTEPVYKRPSTEVKPPPRTQSVVSSVPLVTPEPLRELAPVKPPETAKALPVPVKAIPKTEVPPVVDAPLVVEVPAIKSTAVTDATPPPATTTKAIVEPSRDTAEWKRPVGTSHIVVYSVLGVLGCILLLAVLYVALAYYSANSLISALKNGSQTQLESVVDFAAVQKSLKEQVEMQLANADANGNPASDGILAMIKSSIDLYVTSDGISSLINKSDSITRPDQPQTLTPDVATEILVGLTSQSLKSEGLASPNDFVVDLDVARLHLQFYGTGWKLYRIELKPNLQLSALPTAAPSPPPAAAAPTPPPTTQEAPPASPVPPPPATNAAPSSAETNNPSPLTVPVVETYLDQGNAKYKKGDWAGAIKDFSKVLEINPKEIVAFSNRGNAKQSMNDLDGAIADYSQAIELDPGLAEAYFSRGTAKLGKGDLDGAIKDFTQAIGIDPKMEGAYYYRGNAKVSKGDSDGAIADYSQVLLLNPNHAHAYSNRGYARQAKNDLDGAIGDYSQALAIDPKIAATYYNRGLAKQAQGNLDGAIIDYNQALDLDPKIAGAYYNRGNAKNTKHDMDGAIADYGEALKLDPQNPLAFCNRGLAKQAKGDLDGAITDYNQALTLDPKIAVAYYNRGLIKEQKNDLDGAIADSTRALDIDPKEAQAYYNRGFAKLTKGNLKGADDDLRKFCELVPRDHYSDHARLYLWLIAKAQNPKGDANEELSVSMQNDWNSSPDDLVTKIASFLLERLGEAELLASAVSADAKKDQGQHCEVWYFAGMKRLLVGDKTTASSYFQKCLATGKKDYCEYILAQSELQVLQPTAKN